MDELLLLGDGVDGVIAPEGVSFDGVNDYLSRNTDLVGNVDSKTFTFSCWVYYVSGVIAYSSEVVAGNRRFFVTPRSTQDVRIFARDSSGVDILVVDTATGSLPFNTFVHVLVSMDLSNPANCHVYFNDVSQSFTQTTYTNRDIDFTLANHKIGDATFKGRLAHVYLDYTYRDLSIEANRRLFITEDLKPAEGQAALNPILYLPMRDADTAHINEGTGGDFVPNGVLDTAQRGPNQWNCSAVKLTTDIYRSTALSTIGNGQTSKTVAFSCTFKLNSGLSGIQYLFSTNDNLNGQHFSVYLNSSEQIVIDGYSATNIKEVSFTSTNSVTINKNYHLCFSFDLSSTSRRHLLLNNQSVAGTWSVYDNTAIRVGSNDCSVGGDSSDSFYDYKHTIGEVWYSLNYLNLQSDNIFWDYENEKPKPVRQVIIDSTITPPVALPLHGSHVGKNYGSGGDFNSGSYAGARGGSEFWARTYYNNNISSNRLVNTSVSHSMTPSKTFSFFAVVKRTTVKAWLITFTDTSNNPVMRIELGDTSDTSKVVGWNSSGTLILNGDPDGGLDNDWNMVFVSIDMASPSNSYMIVNGTSKSTFTTFTTNESIKFDTVSNCYLGSQTGADAATVNQTAHGLYFTTDYIDFSQEENRNLFVDQATGYPNDISEKITQGLIPEPLIYLPFDEPSYLGKNLGTGGDFVVNGTISQGSDFSI